MEHVEAFVKILARFLERHKGHLLLWDVITLVEVETEGGNAY